MAGTGYREIFETLRREILTGKFDAEKTLPSEFGLARRFKVCRPTVSRAMRELVAAGLVVRRQGAPTTLSRFAKNASGCIGLVIQGRWNEHDLYPQVCRRLIERAERSGWKMVCCEIVATSKRGRLHEIRKIVDRLTSERVTGIFFQPVEYMSKSGSINADIVARFVRAGIHVVLLDYDIVRQPLRSGFDVVGVDNFAAGYALASHLVGRGFRRVSFLRVPYAAPSIDDRLHGVASALQDLTGRWDPAKDVLVADSVELDRLPAGFSRRGRRAVIASNDDMAIRFCACLRRAGYRIPGDVTVAGFDDIPEAAAHDPPLTTMRQDAGKIAECAFHALLARIKTPGLPPRKLLLPCELVAR